MKSRSRLSPKRSILRSREGVAAVEMALIAPMMILVLFGVVETASLVTTNRRVENVAASMADVIARDTAVTTAEITDLWAAAPYLMFPDSATDMKMRVTSVQVASATSAKVGWSVGRNGLAALVTNAAYTTLPSSLMTPGTSVIVSEVVYTYNPVLKVVLGDILTLSKVEYRRPRVVDPIPFTP